MINLNIGLDQPMNGGSYGIFTFALHRVESYPINRRRWGTTSRVPDRLIAPVENSTKTRMKFALHILVALSFVKSSLQASTHLVLRTLFFLLCIPPTKRLCHC